MATFGKQGVSLLLASVLLDASAAVPSQQPISRAPARNGAASVPARTSNGTEVGAASLPSARALRLESLEQQCLDQVNRIRRAHRLPPLRHSDDLLILARSYSRRMAEEGFFAHEDPQGKGITERLREAGIKWRMVGENIATANGYINPVAVSLRGWMDSPGHRRNILNPAFEQTAVGAWVDLDGTVYLTEVFIRR